MKGGCLGDLGKELVGVSVHEGIDTVLAEVQTDLGHDPEGEQARS